MPNQYCTAKHAGPPRRSRRKIQKQRKVRLLIIATLVVLLAIVSSFTLAYIFTDTDPVINTFNPSEVSCKVVENGSDKTGEFDGVEKTNVKIENTGNVQSYIRAEIVVTWMSKDQTKVLAVTPVLGTDYELTYAPGTAWKQAPDGFWYYTKPVNVSAQTEILVSSCKLIEDRNAPSDDFYLSVEIVASAIQSTPSSTVLELWSSGIESVDSDGTTLVVKEDVKS